MKSLVRWSATLGLIGSTMLATVFGGDFSALALPEDQIIQKLDEVPVFLITNSQGLPLTSNIPQQGQNKNSGGVVTWVYMSRQEAQNFVEKLKKAPNQDSKMKEMVKTLQVTPVPMGAIYKQFRQTNNDPNRLRFAFQAVGQEVEAAKALLQASGQNVKNFPSMPVFIVRAKDKGYVTVKQGNSGKEMIPLFFSKADALELLGQVKGKFPGAEIQVVDVDGVINTMQQKNEPWLQQIVLVPNKEARDFIRTLARNPAQGKPAPAPANNQQRPAPKR